MARSKRARMTNKKSSETLQFFSRRQVLKWTGVVALAGQTLFESRLAHAFRSANTRPKHSGLEREKDLLVDLEDGSTVTLPAFDDASGTLHVVGDGRKTTISWRSS